MGLICNITELNVILILHLYFYQSLFQTFQVSAADRTCNEPDISMPDLPASHNFDIPNFCLFT